MVSKGMKRVLKLLNKRNELDIEERVKKSRKSLEDLASIVELPKDVNKEEVDIDGTRAVWLTSPDIDPENIILYLHGGGYVEGSLRTHQELAERIGRASKAKILLIDYRLAPEHPYPAALEDSIKCYRWLLDKQKISPNNIIISGDSAGGGLTLATLLKLRDLNIALPAAAICLSPWTDLTMSGETMKSNAKEDISLHGYDLYFMASLYIADANPNDPYISPVFGDFSGLPPILIQVGNKEIILDDSVRVAEKAKASGVNIELDVWDEMIHVFQAFAVWAPEGVEAIEKIGKFVLNHFK